MKTLTRASQQLFTRSPDEYFDSLPALQVYCRALKDAGSEVKEKSTVFKPVLTDGQVKLQVNGHPPMGLNDWSFTQVCMMAGVAKETVNRLSGPTAGQVLIETLGQRVNDETEWQALFVNDTTVRSVNGSRYQRLWTADVVMMLLEYATDFTLPQKGFNGATGLYAGDQDVFCFMIDPTGWVEIEGQAFAPGFFVWNSEVGKRTVGISTFWFQAVCANHIVWDATETVEFVRRHTGDVGESLNQIRRILQELVQKRDERKDGFAKTIARAMNTIYGHDKDEVLELLGKAGFAKTLAEKALQIAGQTGRFTIWSIVDALTQLAREQTFAGSRVELDTKAASLLELVSL
jgi:hypothetical protein